MSPLSKVYSGAVALRGRLYDQGWLPSRRLSVPVISVGNLTVGGSGKSPMTAWIARRLSELGRRPAIVSRGYRGRHGGSATVVSGGHGALVGAELGGDEPVMLACQLPGVPIIVSRRRRDGGGLAIERFSADCLILDDGYQHRSLHRDLDLLLVDGSDPFGNGRLLPAGPLREPLRAMARADAVIITRADRAAAAGRGRLASLEATIRAHARADIFHARARPELLLDPSGAGAEPASSLRDVRVLCFAGIARPQTFFQDVAGTGADVAATIAFPDHHRLGEADRARVVAEARRAGAGMIVTTEKDFARLGAPFHDSLRVLTQTISVDEAGALVALLLEAVS